MTQKTRNAGNVSPHRPTSRASASMLVFALAMLSAALSFAALDIEALWVADPDMIMEGAPMVADLDGDGDAEVLTAAYENLIAVDGTGEELWRFDTRGRYSTCPALLERGGAPPLIFAGDNKGMFTCLDGSGQVVWQKDMGAIFGPSPALADLDGDGAIEVIQGDTSGLLSVLDALTGAPVWEHRLNGACASPAAGDLDGDGALEVLIATAAGELAALNSAGERLWEFFLGGTAPLWAIASPVLFAGSDERVRVAAASRDGILYCLDGEGTLQWKRQTRGAIAATLSAGDFDIDGRADVFAVTELGVLYRFDEDGRVLWEIDTQGRSLAPGALIDLDGDGVLEYVLCTQRGNLLVFNNSGEIVFNHHFDNRTINVTPAFGDIVADRPGLEFAITGGESGRIFCFGTSAPADTLAQWRSYRGDNRLTGAWLGLAASKHVRMSPENLNWDTLLSGDSVTFRIVNPAPGDAPLKAEAVCLRPDGSRQVAVGKVVGGRGLLEAPVSIVAPGLYRFAWALKDASDAALVSGSRALTLHPYQNDQALAKRAVIALGGAAEDTMLGAAMHEASLGIEEKAGLLESLQAAVPGSDAGFAEDVAARTAGLNARAKRALALAKVAPQILAEAPDNEVIAFEGLCWENREVDKQLPLAAPNPLRITRRCVPGEHEPISVKLLNVTCDTVRVRARAATAPEGPTVTAHEVKPVPSNQGTIAWDPMVPLGENKVAIPSLETREVWLDIDLENVETGIHAVEVVFDTGASQTEVEIILEVLPFEMASFGAMRLCCWSNYTGDAVADLLAHGNNVFTAALPPAKAGEGPSPKIDIDYTALDAFVSQLAGDDVFLLMNGIPALGVPMASDGYVPRLADYLGQLMAHLAAKGIAEDHVALYPYDEPGGHGWDTVNNYIAFARQGLKARPGLQFYVNGGGDLAMFEAMNEVAAIWCPGFSMLSEDTPEMAFLRGSGKTLWSYDCAYIYARPIGANTKTINIVAQYRLAPAFGLNSGATGIGFWCYNAGPSMWEPIELEYPLVYVNSDGSQTTSRRWEALREGMEDTRLLIALRDRLSDTSVRAETKEQIRHLLEGTLPGLAKQSLDEVRLGLARYVLDETNNDQTVHTLRTEMMDCVASLSR